MSLFKRIKCFIGLHEPMKYVTVEAHCKTYKMCRHCGKLLAMPQRGANDAAKS